ncbi:membrane-associated protein, putative [Bodo saltans]|uniref:Membrane-associated protein, putative n=1 Tax=Bodo saltans TaxID=75058 RepID=A0A0S4JGD8_BODSA|nr:membrane-associated protein, putative [Bodo saltans]|eukprot:CUG90555.1 membrane-associated protein, putative [Bodo saltans]
MRRAVVLATAVVLLTAHFSFCTAAATVFNVPCGGKQRYSETVGVPSGSQIILRNCTNSTVGTTIVFYSDTVVEATNISIIVEHSRRVAVQISTNPALVLSGLRVILNNVTNDAQESSATQSVVCNQSSCLPLFILLTSAVFLTMSVTVMDVLHERNVSVMVLQKLSQDATDLSVLLDRVFVTSSKSVVQLIGMSVALSTIIIHDITFTSLASPTSIVSVTATSLLEASAISVTNVTLIGNAVNVLTFVGLAVSNSTLVVSSVMVAAALASCTVVLLENTAAQHLSLAATHITAASGFSGAFRGIAVQSTNVTLSDIVVANISVATASTVTSDVLLPILLFSGLLKDSTIALESIVIAATSMSLAVLVHSVPPNSMSAAQRFSQLVHHDAELHSDAALLLNGASLQELTVIAQIIVVVSQFVGVAIELLLPDSSRLLFSLSDSHVEGGIALLLQSLAIENSSVRVADSRLDSVASTVLTSGLKLIPVFLLSVTLRWSAFVLVEVNVTSVATSSPSIRAEQVLLEDGTTASMTLRYIYGTGAVLQLIDSSVQDASQLTVRVLENITFPPTLQVAPIYIEQVSIFNLSSLEILLPSNMSWGEGSSAPTFVAIYLANLSIANRSSVVLAAPHGQGALLRWPFQALLVLNTNISNSSEMALSALTLNVSGNVVYAAAYFLETRVVESSVLSFSGVLAVDAFPVPAVNRIVLSGITAATSSHVSFVNVSCAESAPAYYCIQIDRVVSNHSRLTIASGTALSLLISASTFVDGFVDLSHNSGRTANATLRSCSLRVSTLERQRLYFINVGNLPNLTFSKTPIVVTLDTVVAVVPWTGLPTAAAPWVSVVLLNTTSHQLTVVMVVEQLQLLGSVSFVDATSLSNSVEAALSVVILRCSWWGRHVFTGALEPVSLALRGQVFRGPRSAVAPTTSVTASYSSSIYPTSALCSSRYGGYGAKLAGVSWSDTLSGQSTSSKSSLSRTVTELPMTASDRIAATLTTTHSEHFTQTYSLLLRSFTPTLTNTPRTRSTTLQLSASVLQDSASLTMIPFTLTLSRMTLSKSCVEQQTLTSTHWGASTQLLVPTTTLTIPVERQLSSGQSVSALAIARPLAGAIAGSLTLAGSVLIRSSLSLQFAQCASDDPGTSSSLSTALIGSSSSNLFQIHIGSDDNTAGYGYRGALVSSLILVLGSAVLILVAALIKYRVGKHPRQPSDSFWQTVAAESGLPGWWLAGPCAMAVAPMLSAAVSLASVSPWAAGTGAGDGVLVAVSLLLGSVLVTWCSKVLMRPRNGGWFTAVAHGPAHQLQRAPRAVLWLLGGAYAWAPEPRLRTAANRRFVPAYGSLFTSMWPHRHWWFLVDICTSIVVGLLAALPSLVVHRNDAATLVPAVCTAALHTSTAVQIMFMVAYIALRPVAIRWEHAGSLLSVLLGALGALLTSLSAAGVEGLDSVSEGVGVAQIVVAILIVVLAFAEDGFALLTSQQLRWRRHQQNAIPHDVAVCRGILGSRMDASWRTEKDEPYKVLEYLLLMIAEAQLRKMKQ